MTAFALSRTFSDSSWQYCLCYTEVSDVNILYCAYAVFVCHLCTHSVKRGYTGYTIYCQDVDVTRQLLNGISESILIHTIALLTAELRSGNMQWQPAVVVTVRATAAAVPNVSFMIWRKLSYYTVHQ
jgi:hypothetical protein